MAFAPVFPRTFSQTFRVGNAVSAGVTTLVYDTFTAADATAINGRTPSPTTAGYNWTSIAGTPKIYSNAYSSYAGVGLNTAANVNCGQAAVTVTLDFTSGQISGANDLCYVRHQYQNSNNYFELLFGKFSASVLYIIREMSTGGGLVTRATGTATYASNTLYTLSFSLSGTTYTAKINSLNPLSYGPGATVTGGTSVGISLLISPTVTNYSKADNFKATVP